MEPVVNCNEVVYSTGTDHLQVGTMCRVVAAKILLEVQVFMQEQVNKGKHSSCISPAQLPSEPFISQELKKLTQLDKFTYKQLASGLLCLTSMNKPNTDALSCFYFCLSSVRFLSLIWSCQSPV